MKKHLLISGKRNTGKTELFERLLKECHMRIYGLSTRIALTRDDGYHEIYMQPINGNLGYNELNYIGCCNTQKRIIHTEVFNNLGCELLKAEPDGIIAIDEIGFIEKDAHRYCSMILDHLDRDIHVLATVKSLQDSNPFLEAIYNHPEVKLITVNPGSVECLYKQLLPVIESWNEEFICGKA